MARIIFLLGILLIVSACSANILPKEEIPTTENEMCSKTESGCSAEGITQAQCESARGKWNECGSPCAGTDAEFCIQVCKQQCECGGIAGFECPERYACRLSGKIADEMGVCIKG